MSDLEEKAFPANLDSLYNLREYVLSIAASTPLDKKKVYKLQLATDEIATNIISYGFQDQEEQGEILIGSERLQHSLVIYLKDQGTAFDPRGKVELEEGTLTTTAAERRIGGLGIYLAISGVDHFTYEYQDGCNVNRFEQFFENSESSNKA